MMDKPFIVKIYKPFPCQGGRREQFSFPGCTHHPNRKYQDNPYTGNQCTISDGYFLKRLKPGKKVHRA